MNSAFTSPLWITLIGIGLVFITLFLIWALIKLVMWPTAKHAEAEQAEKVATEELPVKTNDQAFIRRRAAAAAVAIALAVEQAAEERQTRTIEMPPSGWQLALRSTRLGQHSAMYSRKLRGASK